MIRPSGFRAAVQFRCSVHYTGSFLTLGEADPQRLGACPIFRFREKLGFL
jgi:hypothetical protein